MDRMTKDDLQSLLTSAGGPHVSIFLPTVRAGQETQQNPIRLKNLLRDAQKRLQERGIDDDAAGNLLAPARRLLDDHDFWQHQEDGLALFVANGDLRTYRLPVRFHELAAVEDRFHLKSLFPLFNLEGHFYVLALAINSVRLLEGTRYEVREVDLRDVPKSLADALGYELEGEGLRLHLASRNASGAPPDAVFHGQSAGEEDHKDEIRKFFSLLDRGVQEYLSGDNAPLVLAGVDYLLPIYRDASGYSNVCKDGVVGNPEMLSSEELHRKAWSLVEEHFRAERRSAAERFGDLAGTGRASNQLDEVLPAAIDGRVDTLFVPRGVRAWGRFGEADRRVERHDEQRSDSEDLLDRAAGQTFLNGGRVFAVAPEEVPGDNGDPVAAIYRW
ncbi:MAG TPA: hypothetical protein VHQ65_13745 [Thermoanaerobaculia bacterium]|nr:hypothetical protein [Thermoanaerobaculia bacterium]